VRLGKGTADAPCRRSGKRGPPPFFDATVELLERLVRNGAAKGIDRRALLRTGFRGIPTAEPAVAATHRRFASADRRFGSSRPLLL
jgi:hypothetical protein